MPTIRVTSNTAWAECTIHIALKNDGKVGQEGLGLEFEQDRDGRCVVRSWSTGGADTTHHPHAARLAEMGAIQVGDVVFAINGRGVDRLPYDDVASLLRFATAPGAPLRLVLLRRGISDAAAARDKAAAASRRATATMGCAAANGSSSDISKETALLNDKRDEIRGEGDARECASVADSSHATEPVAQSAAHTTVQRARSTIPYDDPDGIRNFREAAKLARAQRAAARAEAAKARTIIDAVETEARREKARGDKAARRSERAPGNKGSQENTAPNEARKNVGELDLATANEHAASDQSTAEKASEKEREGDKTVPSVSCPTLLQLVGRELDEPTKRVLLGELLREYGRDPTSKNRFRVVPAIGHNYGGQPVHAVIVPRLNKTAKKKRVEGEISRFRIALKKTQWLDVAMNIATDGDEAKGVEATVQYWLSAQGKKDSLPGHIQNACRAAGYNLTRVTEESAISVEPAMSNPENTGDAENQSCTEAVSGCSSEIDRDPLQGMSTGSYFLDQLETLPMYVHFSKAFSTGEKNIAVLIPERLLVPVSDAKWKRGRFGSQRGKHFPATDFGFKQALEWRDKKLAEWERATGGDARAEMERNKYRSRRKEGEYRRTPCINAESGECPGD